MWPVFALVRIQENRFEGSFSAYTILFKIITRMKLLFSNYLGRYSYSFRARQELSSVTVTCSFVGLTGIFLYSYSSVQLHKIWSSELFSDITVTVT